MLLPANLNTLFLFSGYQFRHSPLSVPIDAGRGRGLMQCSHSASVGYFNTKHIWSSFLRNRIPCGSL